MSEKVKPAGRKKTNRNINLPRKFKGIWIERSIWEYGGLSIVEKAVLAEIDSLDADGEGCYASSAYLADFMGVSRRRMIDIVGKLAEKGLIISRVDNSLKNKISKRGASTTRRKINAKKLAELAKNNSLSTGEENFTSNKSATGEENSTPLVKKSAHFGDATGEEKRTSLVKETAPPYIKKRTNPRPNICLEQIKNNNLKKSSQEILDLDLKISDEKRFFCEQIEKIFYLTKPEKQTFKNITDYLVEQCQSGKLRPAIFKDAVEWARQAKASMASNKKGLLVAKIKKETGYKKQKRLLEVAGGK